MRQKFKLSIITILILLFSADTLVSPYLFDIGTQKLWQHCPNGQHYDGSHCQGTIKLLSWQKSLQYCASLDSKLPWRLPTRNELLQYYYQHGQQKLHWRNLYWSSSTNEEQPQSAWYLIPGLDWVFANYKELDGISLCVADLL